MIEIQRKRSELVARPKVDEEFPARPGETTVGSVLVVEVDLDFRGGEEIVLIRGFG